jgi:hypothetical protein
MAKEPEEKGRQRTGRGVSSGICRRSWFVGAWLGSLRRF